MTKKDQKQIVAIKECIAGHMSVATLCSRLGVTESGLASRMMRLLRAEYNEKHYED